ncbi:LOB domain-containing protein 36 [Pistacia vera]|uniref:LOB domain-containing protein 36 n=1 Tax=Pistacia vera TaxID=55513 RepID=UPI00126331CF|nr:LOB domain-containing protein 36 [Pistacia vera]
MSSSNSPCAACKFLRRKCTQECVFAPYFPPDQPQKFANVHKVFGASNVAKLLNELSTNLREDAVNSLAYEAEARLRDPVYGCVGLISILQHRLKQVQSDLYNAKKELATYIGPQAMMPILQAQAFMPQQHLGNPSSSAVIQQHGMLPMMGIPTGSPHNGQLVIRDQQQQHQHHQQQMFEAQQLAAAVAAREQEMLRNYEQQQQQQQQQDLVRFNSGFDGPTGTVTATGFNHMSAAAISPSLALGSFDNPYQIQPQQPEHHHHSHPHQAQLLLQSQQAQSQPQQQAPQSQQQQKSGSEEGRSVGPSC